MFSGEVVVRTDFTLEAPELEAGVILTRQALPVGSTVESNICPKSTSAVGAAIGFVAQLAPAAGPLGPNVNRPRTAF